MLTVLSSEIRFFAKPPNVRLCKNLPALFKEIQSN